MCLSVILCMCVCRWQRRRSVTCVVSWTNTAFRCRRSARLEECSLTRWLTAFTLLLCPSVCLSAIIVYITCHHHSSVSSFIALLKCSCDDRKLINCWLLVKTLFTVQRYTSTVYAIIVCLSVTPGIVSKWLNLRSVDHANNATQIPETWGFCDETSPRNSNSFMPNGAPNAGWVA